MRFTKSFCTALLLSSFLSFAQRDPQAAPSAQPAPATMDQVVDRMIQQEQSLVKNLGHYTPLVETYLQNLKPDPQMGMVPAADRYFLGRLDSMSDVDQGSLLGKTSMLKKVLGGVSRSYTMQYNPVGFSWMIFADRDDFDRAHYEFRYVRREFLGDVRCIVFDVTPKKSAGGGRFIGRVWAEDQGFNLVRLNGTYTRSGHSQYYFHFDSWRQNLQAGMWLPSFVYSEESDMHYGIKREASFKAQTRIWGYNLKQGGHNSELTDLIVDSPDVKDQSAAAQDSTPVQSTRQWEQQAENNVLERLQRAGLLAPQGDLDKVLETVVNNLMVTNNIELPEPVRCRVLLTTPLESFHVGHTIVVSRGFIDTLPDEASLAMVLSHELGHIVLGHQVDSKFAFNDRMLFSDESTYQKLGFMHTAAEEKAADDKAVAMLKNSPYKDKLAGAGLYLKALGSRSQELSSLLHPHLGNPIADQKAVLRMGELMNSAPELKMADVSQIPALPLGGRVKVDPWTDRAELIKAPAVPIASAREKMIFEVTPMFPHLNREMSEGSVAQNQPAPAAQTAEPASDSQRPKPQY
jgi:Peptidase family M48